MYSLVMAYALATKPRQTHAQRFMTELMNEHIEMVGCPSLIVTRHEAVMFLKSLGYPNQGGFGSIDYMVFGPRRKALDVPLTDDATRERVFAAMRAAEGR